MYIDSHVHLDPFTDAEVADILARARNVGVRAVISAGTTIASTRRSLQLSARFDGFFSGVGIHPMDIRQPFTDETYATLRELALSTRKVLVMSEIGLDFMEGRARSRHSVPCLPRTDPAGARAWVARSLPQPRGARRVRSACCARERAYDVGGIMHYFQGDYRTARKVIDLGFYISLARPLLRLTELQRTAVKTPLENIVLETDAAPQPFKSKRENWTEPRHVATVAQTLAELKGIEVEEVEAVTTRNMRRILGDKWDVLTEFVPETP